MNGVAESGKAQIQDIYNKDMEALETVRNQSALIHLNISQCVNESEDQLNRLTEQLNNEMVICLTNGGNEAMRVVYNVISDVIIVPSVVDNLSVQLEFCGPDINMTQCVAEVLQDVLNDFDSLPERIDNGLQRANGTVFSLEPVLTECAQTTVAQMIDFDQIVDELGNCINDIPPERCPEG
jgi:hypothetical protein